MISAPAQQLLVVNSADATIGKYSHDGATINPAFISGLQQPFGIAVDGQFLYVVQGNGVVKKFTTAGTLVNGELVRGLYGPIGIAISDGFLYVANGGGESSTVGKYTTDGVTVSASLVTGLGNPSGVAIDGDYLYVAEWHTGRVGKYRTDGGGGNRSFVSGLVYPGAVVTDGSGLVYVSSLNGGVTKYSTNGMRFGTLVPGEYNSGLGLALDGRGYLYYANNFGGAGGNRIAKYTTNGVLVNASLITGLRNPVAIAVVPDPPGPTNHPPIANAGIDQLIECSAGTTVVTLNGSASSDPDGGALTYSWWQEAMLLGTGAVLNVNFETGTHLVRLRVSDPLGQTADDAMLVTIDDTTAPQLERITATPAILWPPNHKMVAVTLSPDLIDACDPHAHARIVAVKSNEPVDDREDWLITGALTLKLRAERTGTGGGRTYKVWVEAMDGAGNRVTKSVSVVVPRSLAKSKLRSQSSFIAP